MATINTLVLNEIFQEYLSEEINREATLLRLVAKSPYRRATIPWSVNVGGAVAAGVPISANAPAASYDVVVPASLPINANSLQSTFTVNAKEVEESASQVSAPELRNLMRALMTSAVEEMMTSLNRNMWNGTGTVAQGGIYGLQLAISTADYAGISATTYPLWKAAQLFHTSDGTAAGTTKPLDQDIMFKMERVIREKGGRYDLIVVHPKMMEQYKKLFSTTRTFVVPAYSGEGSVPLVDLGFGVGGFGGVPIIDDIHCRIETAPGVYDEGVMFFMNRRDITFYTVPTQGSNAMSGLYTQMEELARTGLYVTNYVTGVIPQLQVRSRKNCGVIRGVKVG